MRDRLDHLQAVSVSNESFAEHETGQALAPPDPPQDLNPDMEAVFDEAQEARRQIQNISLEVKRLRERNAHIFPGPHTCDSDAIAARIKTSGQEMLAHLRKMDSHGKELAEKHGVNSPVARIARSQYASVSSGFRDAMGDYNAAEISYREACEACIQRQMEIVGREVTGEQMEQMLESGRWDVFSESMGSEGKTAGSALTRIEGRHSELLQLERRVQSLHEVFLDAAILVEEQSSMMDHIHTSVQSAELEVREVLVKLERAKRHDRSNPFKKMFFWKR